MVPGFGRVETPKAKRRGLCPAQARAQQGWVDAAAGCLGSHPDFLPALLGERLH